MVAGGSYGDTVTPWRKGRRRKFRIDSVGYRSFRIFSVTSAHGPTTMLSSDDQTPCCFTTPIYGDISIQNNNKLRTMLTRYI